MHPDHFTCATLRQLPQGAGVQRILSAAIQAVEPGEAVRQYVQRQGNMLFIAGQALSLDRFEHVYLAALGKAALPMADALAGILVDQLTAGLVVPKHTATLPDSRLTILPGGHPVPDEQSLAAGEALLSFCARARPDDLVFFLISGGGSALAASPLPGIALPDLQQLTHALLACGATIDEINVLRRHLDQVKGGGLARRAAPARLISLILSDVVGNALETIASGPTAPDPTTRQQALEVLERYQLSGQISPAILEALNAAPETPKASDPIFTNSQHVLVGSNLLAAQAALRQAEMEGFHPYLLRTDLTGEAREAAFELCQALRWAGQWNDPVPSPACMVAGGETTVTLRGSGKGGRNQELALAAVTELAGFPDVLLVTLATDGEDGPTDAAGAVVNGQSHARALAAGLQPADFLARNDAYNFFSSLDDLLKPGPTDTNVNDLTFLFTF